MNEKEIQIGRSVLFFMQMFSCLGFSILYGTLVLYETQKLHLSDMNSTSLMGSFLAFNFGLHILGGYLGGRFLSFRSLFLIGMILQSCGSALIAFPTYSFLLWGLSFFLAGCGLNVVCINCLLTQLFDPQDKRRESAFLWNYSGMNVGFLIGFTVSGYFQIYQNYHTLFLLSAIGSLISATIALFFWRILKDRETKYAVSAAPDKIRRFIFFLFFLPLLIFILNEFLRHSEFSNVFILITGFLIFAFLFFLSFNQFSTDQGLKIRGFLILSFSSLIFWSLYQMAPMGLTLFYQRNVDHYFFNLQIPPQWLQNINTFVIILGGPLLAFSNQYFRKKGYRISLPFQFTVALCLIGIGYLFLPLGIYFANSQGISAIGWIFMSYFLQAVGELFISPIGYAMVGELIPPSLQGVCMGFWLMITGLGAVFSNYFSQIALGSKQEMTPLASNPQFFKTFLVLGLLAILMSFLVFFIRKILHRYIQEKEDF